MFGARVEIAVVMKKFVAVVNASCRNNDVYRFAYGYAEFAQLAVIACSFDSKFSACHLHHGQMRKELFGLFEIAIGPKALEHFSDNQIAYGYRLAAQQSVENRSGPSLAAIEVIDPDARVDNGLGKYTEAAEPVQLSCLIA